MFFWLHLFLQPIQRKPPHSQHLMSSEPFEAVEFGAGTGHLGLLLAHLRPDISMVLVEVEMDKNAGMERRWVGVLKTISAQSYRRDW